MLPGLLLVAAASRSPANMLGSAVGAGLAGDRDRRQSRDLRRHDARARPTNTGKVFDGSRSATLNFARVNVTVPGIHKTGQIERHKRGKPTIRRNTSPPPTSSPTTRSRNSPSALSADIAARGGRVMVFIHGYNTAFDDAVYRMTQIVHDSGYRRHAGAVLLGVGRQDDRLCLRQRKRQRRPRPARGDAAAAGAVRRAAHRHRRAFDGHLGDHGDAAPAGHHRRPRSRRQARRCRARLARHRRRRVQEPDAPLRQAGQAVHPAAVATTIARCSCPASSPATSRALGDYKDAADLADYGVIVVDLSKVKGTDSFNHTKFADNPTMVKLLGERLREDDGFASDPRRDRPHQDARVPEQRCRRATSRPSRSGARFGTPGS